MAESARALRSVCVGLWERLMRRCRLGAADGANDVCRRPGVGLSVGFLCFFFGSPSLGKGSETRFVIVVLWLTAKEDVGF
jgi:hypothetical protein